MVLDSLKFQMQKSQIARPPKLLLTGFEPFDRFAVNPRWEAASVCAATFSEVVAVRLPVDYHAASNKLIEMLSLHQPTACLCMGLAPTPEFQLEMVARKTVQLCAIVGNLNLHGNWPVELMEQSLQCAGVAYRRSMDAG